MQAPQRRPPDQVSHLLLCCNHASINISVYTHSPAANDKCILEYDTPHRRCSIALSFVLI